MRVDSRIRRPGSSACRTRAPMCPTRPELVLGPVAAVVSTRLTTVSRAASRAMVKPARSGSRHRQQRPDLRPIRVRHVRRIPANPIGMIGRFAVHVREAIARHGGRVEGSGLGRVQQRQQGPGQLSLLRQHAREGPPASSLAATSANSARSRSTRSRQASSVASRRSTRPPPGQHRDRRGQPPPPLADPSTQLRRVLPQDGPHRTGFAYPARARTSGSTWSVSEVPSRQR